MRTVVISYLVLVLLLLPACSASTGSAIDVPFAPAPALDGVITAGEWDRAAVSSFSDGSEVLLMQDGEHLYAAFREKDGQLIAGNLFIAQGESVRILHASAALGSAEYTRQGDIWSLEKDYVWCCRERGTSDKALASREALNAEEGWTSANSFIGDAHTLEYKVKVVPGELRIAASFLYADGTPQKTGFPAEIADDVLLPTPGGLPEEMSLQVDSWAVLQFEQDG